ncbi:hypothetical protein [Rosistilla oblonga]|uniref:Uncharacterized protein n=1 Tax=Rosistilla oblonga TaxID=2527990 RepID=A0A518ITP3_9BACT|nr:hypothetical protein [Rosistilla oblonga]QDV56456.1 hypothetical protein Mal33_24460 [Rosistilla oblonga]
MDVSSLILGALVLLAAILLEWRTPQGGSAGEPESELDTRYYRVRTRRRRMVHLLLGIIGSLSIAAGVLGQGRAFFLIWAAVPLVVFLIVILAMLDAYQTHRYLVKKLPEIQAASFSDIDPEKGLR